MTLLLKFVEIDKLQNWQRKRRPIDQVTQPCLANSRAGRGFRVLTARLLVTFRPMLRQRPFDLSSLEVRLLYYGIKHAYNT
jgi:hypothetical protein